jgi:hypothetical protein
MTDATQPRMARGRTLTAGIVAAALFALLAFAPFASAASDPVGSGTTTVNLSNKFTKYLKTFGIKIQKNGSAKVKGNKATFTVTEGSVDPTTGLGTYKLGGGLKVKAGKKSATIGNMVVNTSKKEISAKVSGKKMKFATIAGWSQARNGFGVNITIKALKITGPAAQQLNKKTGYAKGKPKPFIGGFEIGKGSSEIQPATVGVKATGNANLALSPLALNKLQHVGTPPYPEGASPVAVALSPVAPTTFDVPTLTAGFPFTEGGTIAPSGTAGTLKTAGGLKLVQNLEAVSGIPGNITTLTMSSIWLDLGAKTASVEVIIENPKTAAANLGNLGRASIADIDMSGATITSDSANHTVSVSGAKATLQAVTAATLNQVFIEGLEKASPAFEGQEKFAAGDPLGTVSFTVSTE